MGHRSKGNPVDSSMSSGKRASHTQASLLQTVRQSFSFAVIGLFNTAIDFAAFFLLIHFLRWPIVASQLVSYSFGILNSYLCNRFFTFSHQGKPSPREFAKFVMLNVLSYLLSTAIIYLLRHLSIPVMTGKLLSLIVTVVLNFIGSRYWVFA